MPPLPDDVARAFLAGRDCPCPACRYNLRDAPTAACPECGKRIELDIRAKRPPRPPVVAALALLVCFAASSALTLYRITGFVIPLAVQSKFLLASLWFAVVASALLLLFLAIFRRSHRAHRTFVAGSCWVVAVCFAGALLRDLFGVW